jgi:capsular exopolysaccharide synthesis family protein
MDLVGAISMLRRRWLVIVLCLVAGIAGGYDLGHRGAKSYRASAQCLINIPPAGNVQAQVAGSQLASNLVQTYASLIYSRSVQQRASKLLAADGVSVGAQGMSASVVPNTYLITISATAPLPGLAQQTADAGARALVKFVARLQAGLPQRITVQITSPANFPGSPVSPRPAFDLTVGIVLGLLTGLGLAALLESLDRTVKSVAQGDAVTGVPMVGLIPKRRGGGLVVSTDTQSPEGEPYRSLRTAVRFLDPDKPLRSVLVTSPTPGDGKTVTAANLAAALAASGERVIAVDADLRVPRLAEAFGLDRSVGLTSLVLGTASLDEALQEWSPHLSILASGPLPPNPSEILGSQLVHSLFQELSARADVVIIDAPPVLPVADAVALSVQVDGVLIVLRHGITMRSSSAEATRRLESAGANLLGFVLNALPRSESRGFYADYRYAVEKPGAPVAAVAQRRIPTTDRSAENLSVAANGRGSGRRRQSPTAGKRFGRRSTDWVDR